METLNAQQKEFIIENFKEQLNAVEEETLSLSGTSQSIMEQIIAKLEDVPDMGDMINDNLNER